MSHIERMLLIGIVFLVAVKILTPTMDDRRMDGGDPSAATPNDPVYGRPQSDAGEEIAAGGYDFDPAGFSRDGIPAKLTLDADGRIPARLKLDDTQSAYVYATMIRVYDSLLERAEEACNPQLLEDIQSWRQRQAGILADAVTVLDALNMDRLPRSTRTFLALPPKEFQRRVCPRIERFLSSGGYDPHPEAIDRLSQAAGGR